MASRPSQFPRWADDGGASVTEPSEPEKDLGWVPGNPELDYMNWLQLRAYQWLVWLVQVLRPTDLELADAPLPGGTAPVVGAGLSRIAGFFSARAVAAGVPVPLTDVQAHVYNDSVITYWDLDRDGVWTPVEAGLADPEPAVTANAVRVYIVVTDATDIVEVSDRRPDVIRYRTHSVVGTLRLALSATLNALSGVVSTDLERRTPKLRITADGRSGAIYELLQTYDQNNSFVPWRVYMRMTTGEILWVRGAVLDVTEAPITWTPEATTAVFIGVGTTVRRWELSGLTVGVPFNDTDWPTANATRAPRESRQTGFQFQIPGNAPASDGFLYPHLEHLDDAGENYTPVERLVISGSVVTRYLALVGPGGTVGGEVRATNAQFNPTTGLWTRIAAGDAYLEVLGSNGRRLYRHLAADAGTWADSVAVGNWEVEVQESLGFVTSRVYQPSTSTAATPIANGLYQKNVAKTVAEVSSDGVGGISIVDGHNAASVSIVSANQYARVTFATPMADTNYQVVGAGVGFHTLNYIKTVSYVDIGLYSHTLGQRTFHDAALRFSIAVFGNQ